jgi:hypothetical protein
MGPKQFCRLLQRIVTSSLEQADYGIGQRRQHSWGMTLANPRRILVHEHVTATVQIVLDDPVPPCPGKHLLGISLFRRKIGDEVDHFKALFAAALVVTVARESTHLLDSRETLDGEVAGHQFQPALLNPASAHFARVMLRAARLRGEGPRETPLRGVLWPAGDCLSASADNVHLALR